MHRTAIVLFALLSVPVLAVGQVAWLGSEDMHRAVGGALGSALNGLIPVLIVVVVLLPFGLIYGVTRLIERQFERNGGRPRPVASAGVALVLFALSFWIFMAAGDVFFFSLIGLAVSLAVGILPTAPVLMIELVRLRRSKKRDVVPDVGTESAVASD